MPKIKKEVIIQNSQGLHARPAAMFVQIASKYDSHVTLEKVMKELTGNPLWAY